jgi:hypothetical protein
MALSGPESQGAGVRLFESSPGAESHHPAQRVITRRHKTVITRRHKTVITRRHKTVITRRHKTVITRLVRVIQKNDQSFAISNFKMQIANFKITTT